MDLLIWDNSGSRIWQGRAVRVFFCQGEGRGFESRRPLQIRRSGRCVGAHPPCLPIICPSSAHHLPITVTDTSLTLTAIEW